MAARRYWRVYCTATQNGSGPVELKEFKLRLSSGGANAVGSGVAIESSGVSDDPDHPAFDSILDGEENWQSVGEPQVSPEWVGYDFGTPTAILEVVVRGSSLDASKSPLDYIIQSSDDNILWIDEVTVVGASTWVLDEERTYLVTGALATGKSTLTLNCIVTPLSGKATLALACVPTPLTGKSAVLLNAQSILTGKSSVALSCLSLLPSGVCSLNFNCVSTVTSKSALGFDCLALQSQQGRQWALVVKINGVDVSDRITDSASINAAKDTARIAEFVMLAQQADVDTQAMVDKVITIDYVTRNSGILQTHSRLFTGRINDAVFNKDTAVIHVQCTDKLQSVFEDKDIDFIDALIPARHSSAVHNDTENGWLYAQQRLESVASSYDKDRNGIGRLWDWSAKQTADFTFTETNIVSGSLAITQNTARDIINQIDINFKFRFSRRWQRELLLSWAYPLSFLQWLADPATVPNRSMFLDALDNSWWVKSVYFSKLPPSDVYVDNTGKQVAFFISEENRNSLFFSASAQIANRWLQDVVFEYKAQVRCAASIGQFGVISREENYSLDAPAVENYELERRNGSLNSDGFSYQSDDYAAPQAGSVAVGNGDYYLDNADQDEFNEAFQTAVDVAKVEILSSLKNNETQFNLLVNDTLDIGATVDVATSSLQSVGVVTALDQVFDFNEGSAIAAVTVSTYAPNVAGQANTDTSIPVGPVAEPQADTASIELNSYLGGRTADPAPEDAQGYLGNYTFNRPSNINSFYIGSAPSGAVQYPVQFRIKTPAVIDELRDEETFDATSIIEVAVPQETLSITL